MARARNGLPIFLKELDRWAASAAFTGPINAAQKNEDELQPFNAEYFSKALLGIET